MTFEIDKMGSTEAQLISNYFEALKGQFFKILPMAENKEPSRLVHINSFMSELIGLDSLVEFLHCDARFVSLIAVLRFLADNPETEIKTIRREVFKACSICDTLSKVYGNSDKEV